MFVLQNLNTHLILKFSCLLLLIVIAIISQIRLTVLRASIWAFLLRHNKSKYSGKILYQEEQWHKRSFLWNIEEHPTSSGPFLRGWILNTQYILGILLRTDRSIKRGWWIFFLNQPKNTCFLKVSSSTYFREWLYNKVCKANNTMSWLCEVIHVRNIPHYSVLDWY